MVARVKTWSNGEVLTAAELNAEFDNVVTAQNTVATTTAPGPSELATAAEINTGTDAARTITPDTLAGSNFGIRYVAIPCFAPGTNCSTGDGKNFFEAPAGMSGMSLVSVSQAVYTAGTTNTQDVQIRRIRAGSSADALSTKCTLDSTETSSATAATPAVIDAANDDVATADRWVVDVDAVHTTPAQGLVVTLGFAIA